jgi:hypothetical protein
MRMPVQWEKIHEYARATDPDYADEAAAPVLPTLLPTAVLWESPGDLLAQPAAKEAFAELQIRPEFGALLPAEQEYEYDGALLCSADLLTTTRDSTPWASGGDRAEGTWCRCGLAMEFRDAATGQLRAECLYELVFTSRPAVNEEIR